jgi:hypothetical protein
VPPFGIYPWLFLIPPLLIAAGGLAAFLFSRTELGRRRARYVRAKYGIVTGPEAEAERKRLAQAREAQEAASTTAPAPGEPEPEPSPEGERPTPTPE